MEKQLVKELGEQIGYGNMMYLASQLWKESMITKGYPTSGVFVPTLPCDVQSEDSNNIAPEVDDEIEVLVDRPNISKNKRYMIFRIVEEKNCDTEICFYDDEDKISHIYDDEYILFPQIIVDDE